MFQKHLLSVDHDTRKKTFYSLVLMALYRRLTPYSLYPPPPPPPAKKKKKKSDSVRFTLTGTWLQTFKLLSTISCTCASQPCRLSVCLLSLFFFCCCFVLLVCLYVFFIWISHLLYHPALRRGITPCSSSSALYQEYPTTLLEQINRMLH